MTPFKLGTFWASAKASALGEPPEGPHSSLLLHAGLDRKTTIFYPHLLTPGISISNGSNSKALSSYVVIRRTLATV